MSLASREKARLSLGEVLLRREFEGISPLAVSGMRTSLMTSLEYQCQYRVTVAMELLIFSD